VEDEEWKKAAAEQDHHLCPRWRSGRCRKSFWRWKTRQRRGSSRNAGLVEAVEHVAGADHIARAVLVLVPVLTRSDQIRQD
jgi:hypothetical protein